MTHYLSRLALLKTCVYYTVRATILVLNKVRTSSILNLEESSQMQVNIFWLERMHRYIVYISN